MVGEDSREIVVVVGVPREGQRETLVWRIPQEVPGPEERQAFRGDTRARAGETLPVQ